jgi:hypothetical protein
MALLQEKVEKSGEQQQEIMAINCNCIDHVYTYTGMFHRFPAPTI